MSSGGGCYDFLYLLCRCWTRGRSGRRTTRTDPRVLRSDRPIEFVVPGTTTEDSDTDSSAQIRARDVRRRCTPAIDPQHGLYADCRFLGDLGRVGFSLKYDPRGSRLTVRLIGVRGLPPGTRCARLLLLPEKTPRYVTRSARDDAPFDESFSFRVRRDELRDKKLKISVWDAHSRLVGQLLYNVRDAALNDGETGEVWADLRQEPPATENGEMLLSLCYDPDSTSLTLTVIKVRGLDMRRGGKETTIYAKVTLYVRRKWIRTRKTPSRKKAPEVELNTPFRVRVPPGALGDVDLAVALRERWGRRKGALGMTQVGGHCPCDQGLQHWQDMLDSPKSTCAQWHALF